MNVGGVATFAAATSIQVESGATFQVGAPGNVGTISHGVALTLNGGTADATLYTGYLAGVTLNGGTLTSDSVSSATPSWMLLGDVTVTDDSTISAYNVATNGASRDFNVSAGKRLWMTGSLVDMGPGQATGFTKSGAGDMILYTAAAFTGNVTVNGGALRIESVDGLLAPTTLTIGSAGTVSLSAGSFASSIGNSATGIVANINGLLDVRATGQAFLGAVQLGGGTIAGSANGLVTLLGNVNVTADSTISALNVSTAGVSRDFTVASAKTLTVSGALLDDIAFGPTTFVKKGAGVMRFTGGNANEFTGSVEVAEGTLRVDDVGHVGAQTGWHALGDYTVGASLLVDAGATLALAFGGNYAFSNPVSGAGNLTIEGPGVVTMNSDNSTFTGVTTLAGGRAVISSLGVPTAGSLGSFGGADQSDATTLVFAGGFLEYTGSAHFTRKLTVANGGAGFYANASNSAPFLVDGTSQFAFDVTTASARPLMLSGDSMLSNQFTATGLGSPAAGQAFSSIIKSGVGQWIVGGSGNLLNSDAVVSVNGGLLGFYLNGLGANGSTGNINLANGTTLRWESTNNQDVGSRLKVADGATATIKFDNATSPTTFANGFSFATGGNTGTGSLVKSGAGELILAAANTFSGGLTVAEGKVTVNSSGALGSGAVAIGAGATLSLTLPQDYGFNSPLSGQGTLSLEGTSTYTLGSNNAAFTGVTLISGARVVAGVQSSPTAGTVGTLGGANPADASKLVFVGGTLELAGSDRLTRRFTVANGGATFYANAANASAFRIDGTSQVAFDSATATSRPLRLSGDSVLDNTFATTAFGSPAASQAFSTLIKDGVGKWIVGGDASVLNANAEVMVNGGLLGFYLNGLGANGSTGNINLAGGTTLRWESANNQDVGSRLKVADGATATLRFENTTSATTFANGFSFATSGNAGTGSLVKSGAGELNLAAANTFSGGLTVAEGKVTVNNSGALGSGSTTVGNAGTLVVNQAVTNDIHVSGNGTTGGTLVSVATLLGNVDVGDHGTLARGTSIGNFSATSLTLAGGARLEFKIWDITKAAGTGYDQYQLGNLNLSGASSVNKVVIKLVSLTDGTNFGAAGNLSLLQGTAGIQRFSFGTFNTNGLNLGLNTNVNDLFTFDTSQFTYTGGTASAASLWSIDFNTANGAITLTAVPEPSTYGIGLGALALAAAAIRRRRRQEKKA